VPPKFISLKGCREPKKFEKHCSRVMHPHPLLKGRDESEHTQVE